MFLAKVEVSSEASSLNIEASESKTFRCFAKLHCGKHKVEGEKCVRLQFSLFSSAAQRNLLQEAQIKLFNEEVVQQLIVKPFAEREEKGSCQKFTEAETKTK